MKLYGILHGLADGKLTVRTPKLLKVSIGLGSKCKDIHVHIGPTGQWILTVGPKASPYASQEACQEAYRGAINSAPERRAPKKLPYFTFTRPGPDGQEPDFDAIAAHGPMPRQLEVLAYGTLDQIWRPEMQMWGTRELQCHGDGLTGQRLVALAKTPEEKARVTEGARRFPVQPCFADGCKYATGDNPACKPHAGFYFQLAKYPLVGGTISYETTGFAGIKALGAVLESTIAEDEHVDGLSFMMGIKAYTPRKGSGVAYHATLRPVQGGYAEDVEAPIVPPVASELTEEQQAQVAAAFNSEFRGDGDGPAL